MDSLLNIGGLLLALGVLLTIAFPNLLLPDSKTRTKRVGSTYWGVYEGASTEEAENATTIEVEQTKRKDTVVAGSGMYADGRGTSFRG